MDDGWRDGWRCRLTCHAMSCHAIAMPSPCYAAEEQVPTNASQAGTRRACKATTDLATQRGHGGAAAIRAVFLLAITRRLVKNSLGTLVRKVPEFGGLAPCWRV